MKIEFCHVTVARESGLVALNDFSFVFDSARHSAVAILGANGAGKSTLLEAVLGLLSPSAGNVLLDGVAVGKGKLSEVRRRIGMVFQNSDDQLFCQTVAEDVAFGPRNLRLPEEEIRRRVAAALEQMQLTLLANRDVIRLSGGEKRRVALAGVLAMRPEALLLDEPTSMLDPRGARELGDLLNTLPNLKLIATHDMAFVRRCCPDCLVLKKGRLAAAGATAEILEREDLLLDCDLA